MKRNICYLLGCCLILGMILGCPTEGATGPNTNDDGKSTIEFADGINVMWKYDGEDYRNEVSGRGAGAITYTCSNTSIATIDASGFVHPVTTGAVTITVTKAATPDHTGVESNYSFTINPWAIGDTGPSGVGIVFYVLPGGLSGFEAARATWYDGSSDPTTQWKTSETSTTGTTDDLEAGRTNTYFSMTGDEHPAAALCRNYNGGGRTDWHLPSNKELYELYIRASIVGDLTLNPYWSSTQDSDTTAKVIDIWSPSPFRSLSKTSNNSVRPVRMW